MSFAKLNRIIAGSSAGMVVALTLTASQPALASSESDRAAAAIAPLLDDATYLVLHADLSKTQPSVWVKALGDIAMESGRAVMAADEVAELQQNIERAAVQFDAMASEFTAAGGRDCYLLGTFHAFGPSRPVVIAAPIPDGADGARIMDLMGSLGPAQQLRGMVVIAPPHVVAAMDASPATARPGLAQAWATEADGTTLRAALIPAPYTRRLLSEFMPELPPAMGGASTSSVVAGLQWARITMRTEPAIGASVYVQSANDDASVALRQAIRGGLEAALQMITQGQIGDAGTAAAALTPAVHGDSLTLELDRTGVRSIIDHMRPPLEAARASARQTKSMTQIRQILMAVHIATDANQGVWPNDLDALLGGDEPILTRDLLVNPRREHGLTGTYVYVRPSLAISSPKMRASTLVLAYEGYTQWPSNGLAVGFADGHVEWIVDEARFTELMKPADD